MDERGCGCERAARDGSIRELVGVRVLEWMQTWTAHLCTLRQGRWVDALHHFWRIHRRRGCAVGHLRSTQRALSKTKWPRMQTTKGCVAACMHRCGGRRGKGVGAHSGCAAGAGGVGGFVLRARAVAEH